MQKVKSKIVVFGYLSFLFLLLPGLLNAQPVNTQAAIFNNQAEGVDLEGKQVLVYTKNGEGYVHENIPNSIKAIKELGEKHGFTVDSSEDPADINADNLTKYDALIFSNTNNDVFATQEQHDAFQNYIRSGGGFVGIHSASGSERDWPWFWNLLGGSFYRHAPYQEFTVNITDDSHSSTHFLPEEWIREDECYYLKQLNPGIRVLLQADMTTVEDKEKENFPGKVFGDTYPLAWYHEFEGGRSWYTSLGHSPESYDDPMFRKHILGGIEWVVK
ncbi:ThuA domain-containing protein [Fodinibius salsisoli]|uniref:ThuA domain-containing protein n=1 Tax=Fodinibius salsisoli TaxID=2820877 RepID=A0ABT3PKA0_9BACT|nr:ThuA domain-containing protein [Fodinibius salsisoli]MCW9706370.1 ThuA domain-containing protein [Fodinibius salsisoli]